MFGFDFHALALGELRGGKARVVVAHQRLVHRVAGKTGLHQNLARLLARTGALAQPGGEGFWRHHGPDLTGLFLGDCGAFGIKTELALRLVPERPAAFASFAFERGSELAAAMVALVWANSQWVDSYDALINTKIGPEALNLRLPLYVWAADFLLAFFFFLAGLELKREFIVGELKTVARAAVPVTAAFGGVVVPALVFLAVVTALGGEGDAFRGWAIPTATDIAFALAVLAVISTHLPSGLRSFLLTLAVVDDLIAAAYADGEQVNDARRRRVCGARRTHHQAASPATPNVWATA